MRSGYFPSGCGMQRTFTRWVVKRGKLAKDLVMPRAAIVGGTGQIGRATTRRLPGATSIAFWSSGTGNATRAEPKRGFGTALLILAAGVPILQSISRAGPQPVGEKANSRSRTRWRIS